MVDRLEVEWADVYELLASLGHDMATGFGLAKYLMPELEEMQRAKERKKRQRDSFGLMLNICQPTPGDDETARWLQALKADIERQARDENAKD